MVNLLMSFECVVILLTTDILYMLIADGDVVNMLTKDGDVVILLMAVNGFITEN